MNIEPLELIQEFERQFPRELTICAQAVQIRMLKEQLPVEEPASEPEG